jgi:hypothetical protein
MANRNPLSAGLLLAFLFIVSSTNAQSINSNWKQDMNSLLEKFMTCTASGSDNATCSAFISESINKVYKINGLYSDKSKRYLQLKEVSKNFDDASQWTQLGHAYDQKVLTDAQDLANAHKAVVAVYRTAEGVSHVALILPGEIQFSGTWNFKVPNSASFVLNDPSKSYVGKGLSYAFSRTMIKDVLLYVKKY